MNQQNLIKKIKELATLIQIGGQTEQRMTQLWCLIEVLGSEPTIFSKKISAELSDRVSESLNNDLGEIKVYGHRGV